MCRIGCVCSLLPVPYVLILHFVWGALQEESFRPCSTKINSLIGILGLVFQMLRIMENSTTLPTIRHPAIRRHATFQRFWTFVSDRTYLTSVGRGVGEGAPQKADQGREFLLVKVLIFFYFFYFERRKVRESHRLIPMKTPMPEDASMDEKLFSHTLLSVSSLTSSRMSGEINNF